MPKFAKVSIFFPSFPILHVFVEENTVYDVPSWILNVFVFVCVDALHGIKDLLEHNPAELQSLKFAIIDKLKERLSDDDKSVRDIFYLLFDSKIFPSCVEVFVAFSSFTCLHFSFLC